MKDKYINNSLSLILKYKNYDNNQIKRIKYGLEGIYLTISKLIIIVVLSLILGIFKEVFFTIIFFNILRYFGFGFHAEKSYQCLICSIVNFIIIPYFIISLNITINIIYFICIISIISSILFAPADTVKRPLKNKKKRYIRKIFTFIFVLLYCILILFINNNFITISLLAALVILDIVVNPLTYCFFGQPYKNYKK